MMDNRNKNNNKFLDHGYCSTENKNFLHGNDNTNVVTDTGPGKDVLALLKENKQLKAMLIRHLDLIQEQNDQLIHKDKELIKHQDEMKALRERNIVLEVQVLELQKQIQQQPKRYTTELKTILSPPPLAKIQCKNENINLLKQSGDSGKFISKIILHRIPLPVKNESPQSTSTEELDEEMVVEECEEEGEEEDDDDDEQQENLNRLIVDNNIDCISTSPENINRTIRPRRLTVATPVKMIQSGAKPRRATTLLRPTSGKPLILPPITSKSTAVKICVTPPTPSRGKQMPLMIWHANDLPSDGSISCDSIVDADKSSTTHSPASITESAEIDIKPTSSDLSPPPPPLLPAPTPTQLTSKHPKRRRISQRLKDKERNGDAYLSTTEVYCTRDWEDEEFIYEHEFTIEDANALLEDAPMLEIPKWTEHDIEISYIKENTEDLSDDTFLRRHAKLELDERRRKKWDVQQIREQRRIERLKRRHCKDELQLLEDQESFYSFYPPPETVQLIEFMKTLPVQAFGEMVPKLHELLDYELPWQEYLSPIIILSLVSPKTDMPKSILESGVGSSTIPTGITIPSTLNIDISNLNIQPDTSSYFAFIKKRRKLQQLTPATIASNQIKTTRISSKTADNEDSNLSIAN